MEEKKNNLVETITLTPVPMSERKPWYNIAFIWAGSVICIPALMVGSLVSAGLNFGQSVICMVIGYAIVVLYMCLLGIQSCDLGPFLRLWPSRAPTASAVPRSLFH